MNKLFEAINAFKKFAENLENANNAVPATPTPSTNLQSSLDEDELDTRKKAEIVVNTVVNAAIEKLTNETSNNSNNTSINNNNENIQKPDVASEFFQSGKNAAEQVVKLANNNLKQNENLNS